VFNFTTADDRQACKLPQRVAEPVSGVLEALPGCNPVTLDPVTISDCPRNPSRILSVGEASGVADLTAQGWEYMGCGIDDPQAWGSRALTGGQKHISPMTADGCVAACSSSGFSYAGLEFGSEYVTEVRTCQDA
jgi:hypothetical protein